MEKTNCTGKCVTPFRKIVSVCVCVRFSFLIPPLLPMDCVLGFFFAQLDKFWALLRCASRPGWTNYWQIPGECSCQHVTGAGELRSNGNVWNQPAPANVDFVRFWVRLQIRLGNRITAARKQTHIATCVPPKVSSYCVPELHCKRQHRTGGMVRCVCFCQL